MPVRLSTASIPTTGETCQKLSFNCYLQSSKLYYCMSFYHKLLAYKHNYSKGDLILLLPYVTSEEEKIHGGHQQLPLTLINKLQQQCELLFYYFL